ncbi:hypothetical protein EAE96_005950 [Botrytis aclada]|nr:hypothetical protein EAE96_005950 [Botrytis aclada]
MTSNRYQYKPLTERDSIRLLVLSPSVDTTADIRCDILTTTLDKMHNDIFSGYTALSYVWGDPEKKRVIYIDKEIIEVTANLDSALRDIRDPLREQALWVDAICIDQTNSTEKSNQVAQMAKFYQVARHTIIYLGESTESSILLLGVISRASSRIFNRRIVAAKEILALFFNNVAFYTTEHYDRAMNLFWKLLERPWFTRVWVLQELLFSKSPWVQCGRIRVRWERLFQTIETISVLSSASSRLPESYSRFVATNQRRDSFEPNRKPFEVSPKDLLNLLMDRRGLGISDSRDMLFAHKGILQHSPQKISSKYMELAVDYSKSVREVFVDLARYCVNSSSYGGTLEVLSHVEAGNVCCSKEGEFDLPSWAPNWTFKGCSRPQRRLREMTQGRRDDEILRNVHNNPKIYTTSYLWLNASLVCTGWWVGSIKEVSNIITPTQAGWKLRKEHIVLSLQPNTPQEEVWAQALIELYNHWSDLIKPLWRNTSLSEPLLGLFSPVAPRLTELFMKPHLDMQIIDKIAKALSWSLFYEER